jgi:hypothetical protein
MCISFSVTTHVITLTQFILSPKNFTSLQARGGTVGQRDTRDAKYKRNFVRNAKYAILEKNDNARNDIFGIFYLASIL